MSAMNLKPIPSNMKNAPYSGYLKTEVPAPDTELTQVGPGTPLGEYMRGFWQPVCLSEQLKDLPLAIRILGEDLVAFRDGRGRIGVLHRHCCHRGASLEFAIIQECGIRCCYHGFQYDVDGTIIEVPGEADNGARLKQSVSQGAYPALERDGLVFAYMGAPDRRPEFPVYDAYDAYEDLELLPFSNVYPCNWLQVMDNICDQIHTAFLHNNMVVPGTDPTPTSLSQAFGQLPQLSYKSVRDGTGMVFIAGRRVDDRIWVRINDVILPNMTQHAYLFEDGIARRLFHRVHMTRWYVPVDDTNTIIYGWRMFGESIDPLHKGDRNRLGWDDMDFLEGQVGNRSYEQGQRAPGDWEAIVSQRPIAIHTLENPMSGDVGVYLARKLLREAIRGKNPAALSEHMHARGNAGNRHYCYTQNTILDIPPREDVKEDEALVQEVSKRVLDLTAACDTCGPDERDRKIRADLEELERTFARTLVV